MRPGFPPFLSLVNRNAYTCGFPQKLSPHPPPSSLRPPVHRMAKKKKKVKDHTPRIENRKARHDYDIEEKLEVGIVLTGAEVKSIRDGQVSLAEGFARIEPRTMELLLHDVHIAPYTHAGQNTGEAPSTTRTRKLLAHKREIRRLFGLTTAKGTTLVPLVMYFKAGRVKLEVGVATGRRKGDKRQALKSNEVRKEIQRAMTRKRL